MQKLRAPWARVIVGQPLVLIRTEQNDSRNGRAGWTVPGIRMTTVRRTAGTEPGDPRHIHRIATECVIAGRGDGVQVFRLARELVRDAKRRDFRHRGTTHHLRTVHIACGAKGSLLDRRDAFRFCGSQDSAADRLTQITRQFISVSQGKRPRSPALIVLFPFRNWRFVTFNGVVLFERGQKRGLSGDAEKAGCGMGAIIANLGLVTITQILRGPGLSFAGALNVFAREILFVQEPQHMREAGGERCVSQTRLWVLRVEEPLQRIGH